MIQGGPTTLNPVQHACKIGADIPPRRHSNPCIWHLSLNYLSRAVAARWLSGDLNEETCALATRLEGWYQSLQDLGCAVCFQTARHMSRPRPISFFGERTQWVDVAQCFRFTCDTQLQFHCSAHINKNGKKTAQPGNNKLYIDRRTSVEHHKRRNVLWADLQFLYGLAITYLKVRTVTYVYVVTIKHSVALVSGLSHWAPPRTRWR